MAGEVKSPCKCRDLAPACFFFLVSRSVPPHPLETLLLLKSLRWKPRVKMEVDDDVKCWQNAKRIMNWNMATKHTFFVDCNTYHHTHSSKKKSLRSEWLVPLLLIYFFFTFFLIRLHIISSCLFCWFIIKIYYPFFFCACFFVNQAVCDWWFDWSKWMR